jgi:hypothetical protein
MIDPLNPEHDRALASQLVEMKKAGMAPPAESPAGMALLAGYRRWKEAEAQKALGTETTFINKVSQEDTETAKRKSAKRAAKQMRRARIAMATAGPRNVEDRAVRKAEKAMRYCIEQRVPGNPAAAGFMAYQRAGGRLTRAQFGRKMQGRT